MKQTVRIIAGQYRGKKLHVPDVSGLRPTPDRVRETLFNWLMQSIRGARCLDAFAGSGALGFEAFSRGAERVVFIEQDRHAFDSLNRTAQAFNSPSLSVRQADACIYMKQTQEQFDLIFLDPPFSDGKIPACIAILEEHSVLVPGGFLYVESATNPCLNETRWESIRCKQAGHVLYALYRKIGT
jgi:16S rRNA (guanine966-N2)-methyltransferase